VTLPPDGTCRLAGVVLTYNEENNLPACLASLRGLVSPLLVVDSGSSDRTVEIARAYGAHILSHPFTSHARQWGWALRQLPADVDWVLALDADQYLTEPLRQEIARLFKAPERELRTYAGLYLNRRQIFRGHWIQHGGYYPKYLLKLFRLSAVQIDDRDLMDHHFYVHGRTRKLRSDLVEDNRNEADLGFWLRKHISYARRHAQEELARRIDPEPWVIRPALFGTPDQRVLWLKQRWYALPLYVRPFVYFFFRYVVRLGFLDGKPGFLFHFLQAFWYRLLVDVELEDLLARSAGAGARAGRPATE
jgi:glycosyltransferase involved in cell wall biosynthesis